MRRIRGGPPRHSDRGSGAVELMVVAQVLLLAALLLTAAGRQVAAAIIVEESAHAAARAASLQRTGAAADRAALSAAREELAGRGLACRDHQVDLSVNEFRAGRSVTARVACTMAVADLGPVGAGGARTVEASSTSFIDPYRGEAP